MNNQLQLPARNNNNNNNNTKRGGKIQFPALPHHNIQDTHFQGKLMIPGNKQDIMAHSQKENKLAKMIYEEARILNFLDKDFDSVQDVHKSKETMLKEVKETVRTKTEQTENINHAMKFVQSNQIEIVKLKGTFPK